MSDKQITRTIALAKQITESPIALGISFNGRFDEEDDGDMLELLRLHNTRCDVTLREVKEDGQLLEDDVITFNGLAEIHTIKTGAGEQSGRLTFKLNEVDHATLSKLMGKAVELVAVVRGKAGEDPAGEAAVGGDLDGQQVIGEDETEDAEAEPATA